MDPREFNHADKGRVAPLPATADGESFRIELRVTVGDARALWAAAAARALTVAGMTLDDVAETLGPAEDPSIADCLALLAEPGLLPGARLDGFVVEPAPMIYGLDAAIAA